MDCTKCLDKCASVCCEKVPLPVNTVEDNKHLLIEGTVIYKVDELKKLIAEAPDGRCGFSEKNTGLCSIYKDRPELCQKYGDESHLFLTCPWMDASGNIRSRNARRAIQRQQKAR